MQDEEYQLEVVGRIPLRGKYGVIRGYVTVSASDLPDVGRFAWKLHIRGYAWRPDEQRRCVLMHRQLLGLDFGNPMQGDHINLNKSDNRRSNLRIVTHQQNLQNLSARKGYLSRHRGVVFDRRDGGWYGKVTNLGRNYYTPKRFDEEEVAREVSELRRQLMPFSAQDQIKASS